MAKINRTGRSKGAAPHIRLHHWMLDSTSWRALAPSALKLLIHLWQRHNGKNNGKIAYAVREASEIGLPRSQAARALADLMSRGFIALTRDSAFSVKTRAARLWRITAEPCGNEPPTKDFMRWSPPARRPPKGPVDRTSQSHQRDCDAAAKFRTQSHPRDVQSHQRDILYLPGRGERTGAGTATGSVALKHDDLAGVTAAPGPAAAEHVGAALGINGAPGWRKPTYEIIDLVRPARADMETQPVRTRRPSC